MVGHSLGVAETHEEAYVNFLLIVPLDFLLVFQLTPTPFYSFCFFYLFIYCLRSHSHLQIIM